MAYAPPKPTHTSTKRASPAATRASAARVHFKLEVGAIDDPLEIAADRVADRVMRLPAPAEPSDLGNSTGAEVHRKAEPGAAARSEGVTGSVTAHLGQLPTQPMPGQLRNFFEPRFGRSFDDVGLSTGPQAESLAAHLGARAFSSGTTIGFARGAFTPNTFAGRWLLAHELAHVNQDADQASGVVRRAPPTEDQASTPTRSPASSSRWLDTRPRHRSTRSIGSIGFGRFGTRSWPTPSHSCATRPT